MSADVELQTALYAALSEDDALLRLLAPPKGFHFEGTPPALMLFDKVPDAVMQSFVSGGGVTYATLGESDTRYELAGNPGDEAESVELERHTLTFHVWSQQVGMLEAKRIADAISQAVKDAFANGRLELPSNTIENFDPLAKRADRDRDGFTSHASLTMSCLTQATT